jgi:hypothetical protein
MIFPLFPNILIIVSSIRNFTFNQPLMEALRVKAYVTEIIYYRSPVRSSVDPTLITFQHFKSIPIAHSYRPTIAQRRRLLGALGIKNSNIAPWLGAAMIIGVCQKHE